MTTFKAEKDFPERVENKNDDTNKRNLIPEENIQHIKAEFPKISSEYLN